MINVFNPGAIELDLSGKLKIGGTMEGMVKKPFGIQWLSIGNLKLSFGLDLKTALPSIGIYDFFFSCFICFIDFKSCKLNSCIIYKNLKLNFLKMQTSYIS